MSVNNMSLLDAPQIVKYVYDPTSNAIRVSGSLVQSGYDSIAVTYPSGTQEVYAFYSGGLSGTLVSTVTVNYTDSTKANLLNVVRS